MSACLRTDVRRSGELVETFVIYVINLERSPDRWNTILSQANSIGVSIERVPGVDGCAIRSGDWINVDEKKFELRNGRKILPGEYGCYKAHLSVLEMFVASSHSAAIIVEDDVDLTENFLPRVAAIRDHLPSAELVKLLNHRAKGFRESIVTAYGDRVGRCLHGPQGSAACYLVTRSGAIKLLDQIQTMRYPYDIALERGWKTGVEVYTVANNIVNLSKHSTNSQIADRSQYRAVKIRGLRKMSTHVIRAIEYLRRIWYAL